MPKFYALLPAAGSGSRMMNPVAKQYMPLAGKPLMLYALETLCAAPDICSVFVVLSPLDEDFIRYDWSSCGDKLKPLFCGGLSRAESVLNGLLAVALESDDWVLVHDAARPCLTSQQLTKLIDVLRDDAVGGLLAVPVADTLKRDDGTQHVLNTESRAGLWQAQTPQMFRAGLLVKALQQFNDVTDDASAIEALGLHPKLVASDSTNFKVTYPQDIKLAELLIQQRNEN